MTPTRIECKRCKHALRPDDAGLWRHSGKRGADCACPCEGQVLDELSFKQLDPKPEIGTPYTPPNLAEMPATEALVAMGVLDAEPEPCEPCEDTVPTPANVPTFRCAACGEWVVHALAAEHIAKRHPSPAPESAVTAEQVAPPAPEQLLDDEGLVDYGAVLEQELVDSLDSTDFDINLDEGLFFSNSESKTYKRCKRKWWLSYYRKLQPVEERPYGALQLGTNLHIALAGYYTNGANPITTFAEIYAQVFEDLKVKMPPDIEYIWQEVVRDRELGLIMLEGYAEWLRQTAADEGLRFIAAESRVAFPDFGGTGVTLLAKLDIELEREIDGAHLFLDHKSAANYALLKVLHMDEQMLTYQLIRRMLAPEGVPVTSGLYNILKKVKRTAAAKPPFYQRVEAYHSEKELQSFYLRLTGTIRDSLELRAKLDAGADNRLVAYPTPTRDCEWDCPFFQVCPLFDDGSDAEGYIAVNFKVGNPYSRYDIKTTTED